MLFVSVIVCNVIFAYQPLLAGTKSEPLHTPTSSSYLPIDDRAEMKAILAKSGPFQEDLAVDRLAYYESFRGSLSAEELKELLELVGFEGSQLRSAWAVAMKESRGSVLAHNSNASTGDNSYGLFQINMIGRMGPQRRDQYGLASNEDLFNPVTNARIAYHMSREGSDFGHWGIGPNAYTGGKPRDYPYWLTQYPEE